MAISRHEFSYRNYRCRAFRPDGRRSAGGRLDLKTEWNGEKRGDAMILALGGASWPRLGSDAQWITFLKDRGVSVNEFVPANCGIHIPWSAVFKERFAGTPLKRIAVTSG